MDQAAKDSLRKIVDALFWGAVGALVVAVAFSVFFRVTPFKIVNIHGPSMEPTLSDGDLIVLRTTDSIERDQIAVFGLPEQWESTVQELPEANLIKRVVGMPGDLIRFGENKVEIKSQGDTFFLVEPKILGCELEIGEEIEVPQGEYFLAGDNRIQSFDSMAAWCAGLDPFIPVDTIAINGELKIRLGWFSF